KMGGMRKAMPLRFWSFLIGCAALSALPLTSGYDSKHEILMSVFDVSPALWVAGCLGALITGIYSFRLVFVVFFGPECPVAEKRPSWRIDVPLVLFCMLALFGGMLRMPLDFVFPAALSADHHGFGWISGITVAAPFIGLLIARRLYLTDTPSVQHLWESGMAKQIRLVWLNGWGVDAAYDALVVRPFKNLARVNKSDAVDGIFTAIAWLSQGGHLIFRSAQTGQIRRYASSMALGAVIIIAIGWLS
ncbi:MAG: proton-conducting transporter transmembrane domain-containing protein, partial [Methylomonas sp.]